MSNSNKVLSLTTDSINSLYLKFIRQYVFHHLPHNVANQVEQLLTLNSPLECYSFLSKLVTPSPSNSNDENTTNFNAHTTEAINKSTGISKLQNENPKYGYGQTQNTNQTEGKSKGLKRTNTYTFKDQTSPKFIEQIKGLSFNTQRQQQQYQKQNLSSSKENSSDLNSSGQLQFNSSKNNHSHNSASVNSKNTQQEVNFVEHKHDTSSETALKVSSQKENSDDFESRKNSSIENLYGDYEFKMRKETSQEKYIYGSVSNHSNKLIEEPRSAGLTNPTVTQKFATSKDSVKESDCLPQNEKSLLNKRNGTKIRSIIGNLTEIMRENHRKIERYENMSNHSTKVEKSQQNLSGSGRMESNFAYSSHPLKY